MKLFTLLWSQNREYNAIEFQYLCQTLCVKILKQASPGNMLPIYPIIILKEIKKWFEDPQSCIEMFINFDIYNTNYLLPIPFYTKLIQCICQLGEKAIHVR